MKSETIEYRDGDVRLKGFVAFDDRKAGKRPGILVNRRPLGSDLRQSRVRSGWRSWATLRWRPILTETGPSPRI